MFHVINIDEALAIFLWELCLIHLQLKPLQDNSIYTLAHNRRTFKNKPIKKHSAQK